jgi:tRNA (mo5U34)-methyltransferase
MQQDFFDDLDKFKSKLDLIKTEHKELSFYPYGTLGVFYHIDNLLQDIDLLEMLQGGKVLDIGGSDGDLSFFLNECYGIDCTIIENADTQLNELKGFEVLKSELQSNVELINMNIDKTFELRQKYDFAFFLNILYHLQNPFLALSELRNHVSTCILATRIAKYTPDNILIKDNPVAYLLDDYESNNDPTNYWVFSLEGIHRLIKRTGWKIIKEITVGESDNSTPSDNDKDERYWCLLRRKVI